MREILGVSWVVVLFVVTAGCDAAKENYENCVRLAAKDVGTATSECRMAVKADPNSTSGKAAAALLPDLEAKFAVFTKEQQVKAAEDAKKEKQAKLARVEYLRQKVTTKYDGARPDPFCTAAGKPPYSRYYMGGAYIEDMAVAMADGCVEADQSRSMRFCCPDEP